MKIDEKEFQKLVIQYLKGEITYKAIRDFLGKSKGGGGYPAILLQVRVLVANGTITIYEK